MPIDSRKKNVFVTEELYPYYRGDITGRNGKVHKDVYGMRKRFLENPISIDEFVLLFKIQIENVIDRFNLTDEYLQKIYSKYVDIFNELKSNNLFKIAKSNGKNFYKLLKIESRGTTLNFFLERGWDHETAVAKLKYRQGLCKKERYVERAKRNGLSAEEAEFKHSEIFRKRTEDFRNRPDYKDICYRNGNSNRWQWYLDKINPNTGKNFTEEEAREKIYLKNKTASDSFWRQVRNGERIYKGQNTIYYWLDRGYSEEEAKLKVSERQTTFSLEICIEKYGEEAGRKRWEDRQKKWLVTLDSKSDEEKREILIKKCQRNTYYSEESQVFIFKILDKFNLEINDKLYFGDNEFFCYDYNKKRIFFYDLCVKYKKLIVEYNGSHVHPNPKILDTQEKWSKWRCAFTKKTADEKHADDIDKTKLAESYGFKVFSFFDTDDFQDFCVKINDYLETYNVQLVA